MRKNKKAEKRFFIKDKKGLEMNFAWIFAIIAGVVILFLAIYAVTQWVGTRRQEIDIQTANKLAIILDPLETSLEVGKSSVISFSSEARIYNDRCKIYGNFGSQELGVSISSGVGGKWKDPEYGRIIYNKYIFSDEIEESKEFNVFLKPFDMPFKVSDLIVFTGENYCFVNAPEDIEDEIRSMVRNANFTEKKQECKGKIVCFGQSSGCDIAVYGDYNYASGYVNKDGQTLYYTGPLLYAAIFSSPEVYECNVKRLMLRLVNLCLVYKDKIEVLERRGCSSLLDSHLNEMISLARNLENSQGLYAVKDKADEIDIINSASTCRLYGD